DHRDLHSFPTRRSSDLPSPFHPHSPPSLIILTHASHSSVSPIIFTHVQKHVRIVSARRHFRFCIPPLSYSFTRYSARPSSNSSFAPFGRSSSCPRPASAR